MMVLLNIIRKFYSMLDYKVRIIGYMYGIIGFINNIIWYYNNKIDKC